FRTLLLLSWFPIDPFGLAQTAKPSPSLLSIVDMNTYTLVLSDPTIPTKAKVDLKRLPGWPGPAPEHTLLLPDGKKVLVTYMASATEPVGIAVIKINSINWTAGTADVQVVKNLETDKAGTRSTFPQVSETSPDQYINKKVESDWLSLEPCRLVLLHSRLQKPPSLVRAFGSSIPAQ